MSGSQIDPRFLPRDNSTLQLVPIPTPGEGPRYRLGVKLDPFGPLQAGPNGLTFDPETIHLRYEFTQSSAAATWVIAHNLNKRPSVKVYSLGGAEVDASVLHLTDDVLEVGFDAPFAGRAILLA